MCLAIPGKITDVENGKATVDYGNQQTKARTDLKTPEKGDYVIVQGKQVIEILEEQKAQKILEAWNEVQGQ